MSEERPERFANSAELLRFLQERAEDIERVEIPLFHPVTITDGHQKRHVANVGMLLHMINGDRPYIHIQDAELLLNDGILNRMKIKISLLQPN